MGHGRFDPQQGIGRGYRPVTGKCHARAGIEDRTNRIGVAHPFRPHARYGQFPNVAVVIKPVGLKAGADVQGPEPANIVRVHKLQVVDMVSRVASAIARPGRLDRVQRVSHRGITNGMYVGLEAGGIDQRYMLHQVLTGNHHQPVPVRLIRVWLQQHGGSGFDDAVSPELDGVHAQTLARMPCSQLFHGLELLPAICRAPGQ